MGKLEPGTELPWKVFRASNGALLGIGDAKAGGVTDRQGGLWRSGKEKDLNAAYIVRACNSYGPLLEALEDMCAAAEYWAGCDEGCTPDDAESEILGAGGAWPSLSYRKARAAISFARGASA